MYQDKVIQARLLRAKARFSAGLRGAAHQGKVVALLWWCEMKAFFDALTPVRSDLQAILLLDPSHREARELLPPPGGKMPTRTGRVSQLPLHSKGSPAAGPHRCLVSNAWAPAFFE
jgi:hypothetical protein